MKKLLALAMTAVFCLGVSAQCPHKKNCQKNCPKCEQCDKKDCKKKCNKDCKDCKNCKKQCPNKSGKKCPAKK